MVKNFRCYYGESKISFNADGKITLIYGCSGYGKSSLLQFFRWMLYNNYDFGNKDDKPLFNLAAFEECSAKDKAVEVSGQIDFEHLGVSYRLNKTQLWGPAFKPQKSLMQSNDVMLSIDKKDGEGYKIYSGDIANLLNSILPKGLSKYFLLDGERAREIVLESGELKKAIQSLFGLDAYKEAIQHIDNKNSKYSVLGHYAKTMASQMSTTVKNASIYDLQEALQDTDEKTEILINRMNELREILRRVTTRKEEIVGILGAASVKGNLKELITANNRAIKEYEGKILSVQHEIGILFYRNFPYMILAKLASDSSTILRDKNVEYAASYKNVFENLKKPLMLEILEKDTCVCGRPLSEETRKYIQDIISIMPPGSYAYEFGQFIKKARTQIEESRAEKIRYEELIARIVDYQDEIRKLDDANTEKLEELKKYEESKDLAEEYEELKGKAAKLDKEIAKIQGDISFNKKASLTVQAQLNKLIANSKVSAEYQERITFFEDISKLLRLESVEKEQRVRIHLDSCVREIFKKLTTQADLDADKIRFVNDDFSLRSTYLTGGQLAIDVYSYVIGIIKALQEFKMDSNETPIIIDAPFAFTDNTQSEHIFKTLPSVSKQTILLTLDLNKIKRLLMDEEAFDFYYIKNDTQDKATIERGNINDFKY